MKKMDAFLEKYGAYMGLLLLVVGLYGTTLGHKYALDDTMVVTKNRFVAQGWQGIDSIFSTESFTGYFPSSKSLVAGQRYRPLSIASFAVEEALWGAPKTLIDEVEKVKIDQKSGLLPFRHAVNVFLYALTVCLAYYFFSYLMTLNTQNLSSKRVWVYTIVFLFACHPLHTEVVANIKGRDELLCFLGLISTLFFYSKAVQNPNWKHFSALFLSFLVSLFSKEQGVIGLFWAPLTVFFCLNIPLRQQLWPFLCLSLAAALFLACRQHALGGFGTWNAPDDLMNNPFLGMNTWEKSATISHTLGQYFKLFIIPYPLTHDYYPYHIPKMTWQMAAPWLSLALHIGLIVVAIVGTRRREWYAYGLWIYLSGLALVSNIFFPVGSFMNERFLYQSSFGLCISMVYTFEKISNFRFRHVLIGLYSMILVVLTHKRLPDWYDNNTLNKSAILASPNSARAQLFYGVTLWDENYLSLPPSATADQKQAVLRDIMPYFQRSLAIVPNYVAAQRMLVAVYMAQYDLDHNPAPVREALWPLLLRGPYDTYARRCLQTLSTDSLQPLSDRQEFLEKIIEKQTEKHADRRWQPDLEALKKEISVKK